MSQQRAILTGEMERETPEAVFRPLDDEFHFDLDACATARNTKVARYLGYGGLWPDALGCDWADYGARIWCNPPYGRGQIAVFLAKAEAARQRGATVVCLLPVDTSTSWFHDWCIGHEIRFLRGRVRFGGTDGPAPFGSMVVVLRP